MSSKIVIIGAGGFAREVLDVLEATIAAGQKSEVLGFVVDPAYGTPGTLVNDKPILGSFDWLEKHAAQVNVICGVGDPAVRWRLIQRVKPLQVQFCNAIHPSAQLTRWLQTGIGVVITAGCVLSNQIYIHNHVHLNPSCTVGHDVVMEDFVSLSPGVLVSGNVRLKTGAFIGTGAAIIQKIQVGEWSTVGAGSTIIRDVLPNTTVVGVPGQAIKTRPNGWYMQP